MEKVITAYSYIGAGKAVASGTLVFHQENIPNFAGFIKDLYRQEKVSYPKFFKMDSLSKLGFMAAELLFRGDLAGRFEPDRLAVVLSNSSSSLDTDLTHQESIRNRSAYFPSPSVFVYTLANIVIGEICIRHRIKGENAFLISEKFNPALISRKVGDLMDNKRADAVLCGWVEILGNSFKALTALVEYRESNGVQDSAELRKIPFSDKALAKLIIENE